MNYYRRYPGDYARDTANLSLIQHGAYCLLLDHCYSREALKLPESIEDAYRICKAITPEERTAVRFVVRGFFPEKRNPRVARQLPEEIARISAARRNGRRGSEIRWGRQGDTQGDTQSDTQPHRPGCRNPIRSPSPSPSPSSSLKKLLIKAASSCAVTSAKAEGPAPAAINGSEIFLQTCKLDEIWEVPNEKLTQWEESYPDVDVRLTLLGIRQWLRDNPKRRKTARGMTRFVSSWLMREQDKPTPDPHAKTPTLRR